MSRSPLEREALKTLVDYGLNFDQEKTIEKFRYDFAVPALNLLIEIDSHSYHSHPSRKRIDRLKTIIAERAGWKLVRLTGDDIQGKLQAALDKSFAEVGLAT